ncbi:MAG: fluoride efflux transporter CrcB [Actinomycetota bacterium]|jgi:CrcB protein
MNWTFAAAVALGGAVGAPLRLLIDSRVTQALAGSNESTKRTDAFPWGLLVVNALGSLLIGIAYASVDGPWRALIATGAFGALTTYSSYALFIHGEWRTNRTAAWRAIITMPVVCITACALAVVTSRTVIGA